MSEEPPRHVGWVCRCAVCCCKPGQGHKHPDWIAYERAARKADV